MDEYKALEDFQLIATTEQLNVHQVLKSKMKIWNTKNKNYHIALKRSEHKLPPKFITKTELNFKIDEAIVNSQEAQTAYNRMHQITNTFRTHAMALYVEMAARECELLKHEIDGTVKGFPKENNDQDDSRLAAFTRYHDFRQLRFNLEVDQSCYFLAEQRVEGEINYLEEEIAPTLVRSLGTELSVQI
jgi:hypothetical protein